MLRFLKNKKTLWVALTCLFASGARASETSIQNSQSTVSSHQVHLRLGMLSGSFSGAATGSLSVSNTLDAEYEIFQASKRSFTIRGILAQDLSSQQTKYSYIGMGKRYYFKSKGNSFISASESAQITSQPKWRYYAGGDVGVAHVLVRTFGDVLSATGSVIDFGVHVGTIMQTSKNFGIEAQFGYTMGFGISSISIGSTTMRFLLGGAFFF